MHGHGHGHGSLQRVQAGSWPWPGAVFVVAAMALVLNWCLVVTTCLPLAFFRSALTTLLLLLLILIDPAMAGVASTPVGLEPAVSASSSSTPCLKKVADDHHVKHTRGCRDPLRRAAPEKPHRPLFVSLSRSHHVLCVVHF